MERILVFWVCCNVPCKAIPNHCDFYGCPRCMWLNRQSSLPSADPTTLTGNAVFSWNIQSQGERHCKSSLVVGQQIQLCVSPSLLILPDLLTHYALKFHYLNFLSATPYLPVPPRLFPALRTRITFGSLCHFYLKSCTHYPVFGEKTCCLYHAHTHYYHCTCDISTHHWNSHKIITCKTRKPEISSSIF